MFNRETFSGESDVGPLEKPIRDKSGKVTNVFEFLKKSEPEEFYQLMIQNYREVNDENDRLNQSRSELIWFSQWMISIGIFLVPTSSIIGFIGTSNDLEVIEPPRANAGSDMTVTENSMLSLPKAKL